MKRIICLLAVLCLLMTCVLTACGDSAVSAESAVSEASVSAPAEESAPVPEAPETGSAPEAEASAELPEPEPIEVSYPLTEERVDLHMWSEQPNLGPLRMWGGDYGIDLFEDYSSIQYANELTNVYVSFENVSMENASTLFNLHVASGDWADMLSGVNLYYAGGSGKAFSDGVLLDINDYMEEYAPNYYALVQGNSDIYRCSANEDGDIVEFCSVLGSFMQSEGTVIRKDWLDEIGKDVPTTLEELYDVLKLFQSEMGCDNPFYFNSACNQLLTSYNLAYIQALSAGSLAIYQVDGEVTSNYVSDAFRDWLKNMNGWYAEGLIDPDFISVSSSMFGGHDEELLAADNIGVWWGNINSMTNYYAMCPAENFDVAPAFIFATDDHANHSTATSLVFSGGTALSANCSNPEMACGWLDFWYSEEGINVMNYGLEGESYEMVDGEVQYTDVVMNSEFGIDSAVALKLYSIAGCSFGVQLDERTFPFYIDCQMAASKVWTEPCDGEWAYPSVTFTDEESDTIGGSGPDVATYVAENVPRFIMGELDPDKDWDEFVSTVKSMGMDTCIEAYQSALDRYLAA